MKNVKASAYSVRELVSLSLLLFLISAILIAAVSSYPVTQDYSKISEAIRDRNSSELQNSEAKQFWGLPYLSVLVVTFTGVKDSVALAFIALCCYLLAVVLTYLLWGDVVAAWFSVVNWSWLREAVTGGAEPLFMCLLLATFLFARKNRWLLAAVFASFATVVRPLGLFALAAIGIALAMRREFRMLMVVVLSSALIGALSLVPVMMICGDPFANIHGYEHQDWAGHGPITVPMVPIVRGAVIADDMRAPLWLLSMAWVLFMMLGVAAMVKRKGFRDYAVAHPVEAMFAAIYTAFIFSYNSPYWAWHDFPRFALPLLPFALFALIDRLPGDRRLLWGIGFASVVCVVLPVIGVDRVYHVLLGHAGFAR